MLLKNLFLKNFRQFNEEQSIDFSTDPERNVTVIIGKNTGGKTTIVQAFIWCLYGKITFDDHVLLNQERYVNLYDKGVGARETVEVSVRLIHDNKEYYISRTMKYDLVKENKIEDKSKFSIKCGNKNGALMPIDTNELENVIYKILPQSLSDYFFFWGERIENLSKKSTVSTAVKDFLGLSVVDNAKKHLDGVIKKFDTTFDANYDSKIRMIVEKIKKYEESIERNDIEIEEQKNELEHYHRKYTEKQEELRKNPDSAPIQKRIEEIKRSKYAAEKRLSESKNQLYSNFNDNAYIYFSQKIAEKAVMLIDKLPEEEKGYAFQSRKSLKEILDRKVCLCGAKLDDPSTETYQHFIEIFNRVAPNSIKSLCDEYKVQVKSNNIIFSEYSNKFNREYRVMDDLIADVEDYEGKLHDLEKEIHSYSDLSGVKMEAETYLDRKIKASNRITELETRNEIDKKEVTRLIEKKDRLMSANDKSRKILKYKNYAIAVLNSIKEEYDGKEKVINERINELVNSYFQIMYHGDRTLSISKDFKIELINEVQGRKTKTDASPGLETVKNFAFVAGLVELAKEKVGTIEDENIMQSEPYPLVLDAPFSQADEIHVPNICKLISEVAEQTIIVVMKKDWAYAEEVMKDKVGKYYTLEKESEIYTRVVQGYKGEVL